MTKCRKLCFLLRSSQQGLKDPLTGCLSPRRSSDGVSAAGIVVVSRLKMGEMEEADIDYISTEKTSHKVQKLQSRDKEGVCLVLRKPAANAGISQTLLKSSNEIK